MPSTLLSLHHFGISDNDHSFLVFPSAFASTSSSAVDPKSGLVGALVLVILGYSTSLALSLLIESWLFQLDIIYVPHLTASAVGLINVLYALNTNRDLGYNRAAIAALALSSTSTLVYAVAALLTFRKIHIVRSRNVMYRHHSSSSTSKLLPETELQRQQLLRLLLQQEDARAPSPECDSQQTFKIDWPGSNERFERRSTLSTIRNLPRLGSRYGSHRTSSHYTHAPTENLTYGNEGVPMTLIEEGSITSTSPPQLQPISYTPPPPFHSTNTATHDIPVIINTQTSSFPPQLQDNGYPLEKSLLHPSSHSRQPSKQLAEYRMAEEFAPMRKGDRESRRIEIELADRSGEGRRSRPESEMDADLVGSIRRVETDGWSRQL